MKKIILFLFVFTSVCAFSNDKLDQVISSDDLDEFIRLSDNKLSVDYLTKSINSNATTIFNYLLKKQIDVNAFDTQGNTPLLSACMADNKAFAMELLKAKANPNLAGKSNLEGTPLMYAAANNNVEILKMLMDNGANVNQLDVNKDHALNWATYYGYLQAMEFLIENGADVELSSKHGKAVDVGFRLWFGDSVAAVFRKHMALEKIDKKSSVFIEAIKANDTELVSKLVKKSVNVNTKDELGTPAIHFAVENGNTDIISVLIAAGVDVNALNRVGQAPLSWAARNGNKEITKQLLENGADANATGEKYRLTPLIGAAVGGDVEIAKLLLKYGAAINVTDYVNGGSALHWAMFYGYSDFATLMVKSGADFNKSILGNDYNGKSLAKAYNDEQTLRAMEEIENAKNPLFGSWKMYQIDYVYADTTYNVILEYPGRLIIANNTYSIMHNPYGSARKSGVDISKLTEEEMIYAFKTLAFNSGSYTLSDSLLSTKADIAKVAGFEGGEQYYTVKIVEDTLLLTMFDETYPDGKKPEWYGKLKILFKLKREW